MVINRSNKPPKRNLVGNVSGNIKKPLKGKRIAKTRSNKTEINGVIFDSETESKYYLYLLKDKSIKSIELQPQYTIIEPYQVRCKRCLGRGKVTNAKTLRGNNCTLCKGKRKRPKGGAVYTADFRVTYIDGYEEVIDVKGGPVTADFSLRKRMWESIYGKELIVVRWNTKKKDWIRE